MLQNIITNPRLLKQLRQYSMLRARECEGAARKVWVEYARADNRRLVKEKRA